MTIPNKKPRFQLCEHCQYLKTISTDPLPCPAMKYDTPADADLETIKRHAPFSQWQTPEQIGKSYSYSAKQIIRIVQQSRKKVTSTLVNGRWFVLRCTFDDYMDHHYDGED